MTVCVAAICQSESGPLVIGAADRMITAGVGVGDIEYEPRQRKIYRLTNAIAAMASGDMALQHSLMSELGPVIGERIATDPTRWWTVREVAELYSRHYLEERNRVVERKILAPVGLDWASFRSRESSLPRYLVDDALGRIRDYKMPTISTLFMGLDPTGPHIFGAYGPNIVSHDVSGFGAIGNGDWHAQSQFMFAKHTASDSLPRTLLLTYFAKKRAEVAPGVGSGTDMIWFGPSLGTYAEPDESDIEGLERIYQEALRDEERSTAKAQRSIEAYVKEITARESGYPQAPSRWKLEGSALPSATSI